MIRAISITAAIVVGALVLSLGFAGYERGGREYADSAAKDRGSIKSSVRNSSREKVLQELFGREKAGADRMEK